MMEGDTETRSQALGSVFEVLGMELTKVVKDTVRKPTASTNLEPWSSQSLAQHLECMQELKLDLLANVQLTLHVSHLANGTAAVSV